MNEVFQWIKNKNVEIHGKFMPNCGNFYFEVKVQKTIGMKRTE